MDWITACGILDVPPDASEQRIKEQRNYWLNVLHPDKTTGLPPRIKIKADKDFVEKKAAWEYLLILGNRPASRSSGKSQESPRERPASTPQNEPSSSSKSKPKPVVTPSNIVFNDMEPGQSKKASFVVDNTGGPFDILQVSNPKSWLKIIAKHYSSTAKGLPLKVEIEATGLDWGVKSSENIYVELDDVKTTLTAEVRMKPKPTSDSTNHVEPNKVPRWAIVILIVLLLGLFRFVASKVNLGSLNSPSTTTSIASTTAQEHVIKGDSYYAQKQWDNVIAEYTTAMQLDPNLVTDELNSNLASAYNNRGLAYQNTRDYDKAIADYTQAIKIDPKNSTAYFYRGFPYYMEGNYDKAISDYTKAIELDPKLALAYLYRGWVYDSKGEYDKAISEYTKAIELDPKLYLAYDDRGHAYGNKGDYDKAITDCTKAIEINPKWAMAYYNRGLAYQNTRDYDKAIADYTKMIELNPKYAKAYFYRGLAYEMKGQGDIAIDDYNKAKELGYK